MGDAINQSITMDLILEECIDQLKQVTIYKHSIDPKEIPLYIYMLKQRGYDCEEFMGFIKLI